MFERVNRISRTRQVNLPFYFYNFTTPTRYHLRMRLRHEQHKTAN